MNSWLGDHASLPYSSLYEREQIRSIWMTLQYSSLKLCQFPSTIIIKCIILIYYHMDDTKSKQWLIIVGSIEW